MTAWIATACGLAMTALGACTVSLVGMAVVVAFMLVIVVMDTVRMRVGMAFVSVVAVAMPVPVSARGVSAVFRLKAFVHRVHDQVHSAQHVGQHVVGLDLQVVGLEFDGHMPIAQVVGGANQVIRRAVLGAVGNLEHRLRRGDGAHQRTVLSKQYITAPQNRTARQEHTDTAPEAVGGFKPAFLSNIPVQLQRGRALDHHGRQALALGNKFGYFEACHSYSGAVAKEVSMNELKLIDVNGEVGIIFPEALCQRLQVSLGDELHVEPAPNGMLIYTNAAETKLLFQKPTD